MRKRTVVYNNELEDAKKRLPYNTHQIATHNISVPPPPRKETEYDNKMPKDWARAALYWNVKNGGSNFNNEKEENIYFDFEIGTIANSLKGSNLGEEEIAPCYLKAKNTLRKLADELLSGYLMNNYESLDEVL